MATPSFLESGDFVGRVSSVTENNIYNALGSVTGVTATHKKYGQSPYILSTFTLSAVSQAVVNGTEYQSTQIFTFPPGLILFPNCEFSLTQTTTSDPTTTLNASSTGAVSVGSAAASATTLSGTMANFLPSTAFVSSATQNVAGTTVTATLDANDDLAEMFTLDGTSTATSLYLNSAFATTTDVDADATMTWSGTIKIKWLFYKSTVVS